jgi:DNA-binding NtrC family response regulator
MPTQGSPTSVSGQTIPIDVLSGNQVTPVPPGQVLLVDDDPAVLRLLEFELGEGEVSTVAASDGRQALELLKKTDIDAIILDLALPDISGRELLKRFKTQCPDIPVIVLTARDEIDEAVACMKLGARDFVTKPFDRPRLMTSVQNACKDRCAQAQLLQLATERRQSMGFDSLIGRSTGMDKVKALLARATNNDVTVLLEGESGTGKEVFARALHAESHRSSGAFVAVNCGAIPESLIESELFGHCKGSFTGAIADHCGFFEQAEGGTILLDEIGELPLSAQVRLLRVLQERQVQRIGDKAPRAVDVRIVAATNQCLADLVPKGEFRKDLFYRLAVFPITLPPLRDRQGDIPLLSAAFLERISQRLGRNRCRLDQTAIQAMGQYNWPGNVRELENALERACLLAENEMVTAAELPDPVLCTLLPEEPAVTFSSLSLLDSQEIPTLADEERRLILHALRVTHWNLSKAAQKLGIGRATIYRKIERYGLQRQTEQHPPTAHQG